MTVVVATAFAAAAVVGVSYGSSAATDCGVGLVAGVATDGVSYGSSGVVGFVDAATTVFGDGVSYGSNVVDDGTAPVLAAVGSS